MMKIILAQILLGLCAVASASGDTPLSIGIVSAGVGGPCWDDTLVVMNPPYASNTFTLPGGAMGTGTLVSSVAYVGNTIQEHQYLKYDYTLDMSGISAPSAHCVKLLVHFGTPHTCTYDVLVFTNGGLTPSSAGKAPYGDITFGFGPGCLLPGELADTFGMLTDQQPKTNFVTIIDDYTDPASGQTNEARILVGAVVPNIPPNWAYAPLPLPNVFFQGGLNIVGTNQVQSNLPPNGAYDLTFQLVDAPSNGLPLSLVVTQTVQVVNGLFNAPLAFDPSSFNGGLDWLSISVRPSGVAGTPFTPLNSALPINPVPEALYAYSAGVVADLAPSQAVLSLNGISGNAILQGGPGIDVTLNGDGKTITISQTGAPSDRNIKTNFAAVNPLDILAKLVALPVQSWRFTNETAAVRHLGPMAQDFKSTFGLGTDNRSIGIVDEGGVALAAIQGLNAKVEQKEAEITDLKHRLEKLEQLLQSQNKKQ